MPRLKAPEHGVAVRMYRQGHGDCFLLALPRANDPDPVYVLIDCGVKPGSEAFLHGKDIGEIVQHIGESTGFRLDLVVLTHEHQDHLNGIWRKNNPHFGPFQIGEAWLAWTEDPADPLANELRRRHRDQLLGLVAARRELALAAGEDDATVRRLDTFLAMELGGPDAAFNADTLLRAASDPANSANKQGMKLVKDKAAQHRGVRYLGPGEGPLAIEGTAGMRAFVLGPPRNATLIADEDPVGREGFPAMAGLSFAAAAAAPAGRRVSPFGARYRLSLAEALAARRSVFARHYGRGSGGEDETQGIEVPETAAWRRIDHEWLYSAENLALKLNTGINNTSLVLALELPASRKVLLFAADAQRGNWISWDDRTWRDGDRTVTARDLLERTVLYKVGHHGSHNATLAGTVADAYPNLSWMGQGRYGAEFTAMITAVNEWAMTKNDPPWQHPLPSIRRALLQKAQGRVFQTDKDRPRRPANVSSDTWKQFQSRFTATELYFDLNVLDQ